MTNEQAAKIEEARVAAEGVITAHVLYDSAAATALAIVLPADQIDDALMLLGDENAETFSRAAVRVQEISARIPKGRVETQQQADDVNTLMSLAKNTVKAVEISRKAITKPLDDQVSAINNLYRPLTDALKYVVTRCEPLVVAWLQAKQAAQERERLEAQRLKLEAEQREVAARLAAEDAKSEQERREHLAAASNAMQDAALAQIVAPPPIKGIATHAGSHSLVTTWHAVVSEPEKLARVWLMPNQAAIDDALAAKVQEMRAKGGSVPEFNEEGITIEERTGLRKGKGV